MPGWSNHALVDVVDDVLTTAIELAYDLGEDAADRPTACPGWSVRDHLAHMVGLEQVLGGAPEPRVELPALDHVVNELDAFMERQVHARRGLPLVSIADEMAGMRPRRLAQLRAAADEGDPNVRSPRGERPLSAALPVRVFDLWVHEQDVRRAVGLPVRTECDAAVIGLGRALGAWAGALPERVDVPGRLIIEVKGGSHPDTAVALGGDASDGGVAEARLAGDVDGLLRAFCGRGAPLDEMLTGDLGLVAAIGPRLAMTP